MTELKSRAHPDWPYTGTPWEWRGFRVAIAREKVMRNHSEVLAYLAESERKDLAGLVDPSKLDAIRQVANGPRC
jgi:hypothetical protein